MLKDHNAVTPVRLSGDKVNSDDCDVIIGDVGGVVVLVV